MLITLDAELQAQRKRDLDHLQKMHGGTEKMEVDKNGQLVVEAGSYPIPIPTIITKVKVA